jgi:hypothetical protein
MSCDCESYTCLEPSPAIVQCGEDISVLLAANETATWLMSVEFNGRWRGVQIEVVNTELLELPNVFNENYTHKIKFYTAGGALVNDTCYEFNSASIIGTASGVTSPSSSSGLQYATVTADANGDSIDFSLGTPIVVITSGQSYDDGFTWNGSTIVWTNGNTFYNGQKVTVLYA